MGQIYFADTIEVVANVCSASTSELFAKPLLTLNSSKKVKRKNRFITSILKQFLIPIPLD